MKKYHKENFNLLYLTSNGREPSYHSIDKKQQVEYKEMGKLKIISANDIYTWLDDSMAYAKNVELFISQFKKFIKEDIMGINTSLENSKLIDGICQNEKSIGNFFQLARMKDTIYINLMNRLSEQLQSKLNNEKERFSNWIFKVSLPNGYWIAKDKYLVFECVKTGRNFEFILGTDTLYFNPFYFALRVKDINIENYDEVVEIGKHLRKYFGLGNASKWCPYWYNLGEPYGRNWETVIKPWQDISNGKLANYIFDEFQKTGQFLEENNYV